MATPTPDSTAGDFKHSIFNLLNRHPLYNYCTPQGGEYLLSILLIGSGEKLNQLRNMLLSHGQLLNTQLEVTVVTEDIQAERALLKQEAPELDRFILFRGIQPEHSLEWNLGTLAYETNTAIRDQLPAILAAHSQYRYVLISEECVTEEVKALAPTSGQLVAWIEGDSIRSCGQEIFGPVLDTGLSEQIQDIAYRIHYAYEKGKDPRKTHREIRKSFEDPYNRASNTECAIHVRSKVWSAGIDPAAPNFAEQFSQALEDDLQQQGRLMQQLAQLEHKRWCVSKLVKKLRLGTAQQCCQAPGETSHNSAEKLHACLVPYKSDKNSSTGFPRRLTDADWDAPHPEYLPGLDPLDLQTLLIHKRCGELMPQRLDASLEILENLKQMLDGTLAAYVDNLCCDLEEMRSENRDSVLFFREHLHTLHQAVELQGPDSASGLLDDLITQMTVPLEYLMRKDYKEVNLSIIRQIALSTNKVSTMVKLMSQSDWECIDAAYQLQPGKLVFLEIIQNLAELSALQERAKRIDSFLKAYRPEIQVSYHILAPTMIPRLSSGYHKIPAVQLRKNCPELFSHWTCTVHGGEIRTLEGIRILLKPLMREICPTAIDTTGGKPLLDRYVSEYASFVPVSAFSIQGNEICDIRGSQILAWLVLDRSFSIKELFDIANAREFKEDAKSISTVFRAQYRDLWKIAHATDKWYWYSQSFDAATEKSPEFTEDGLEVAFNLIAKRATAHVKAGEKDAKKAQLLDTLRPITGQLVSAGILQYHKDSRSYTASCPEALSALQNSGKALEYFICCSAQQSGYFTDVVMSWFFRHGEDSHAAKNEIDVICTHPNASLFISAKHVNEKTFDAAFLQAACMQVHWLAHHFGGQNPKPILAAPIVSCYGKNGDWHPNVKRARDWGVYLLGRECFDDNRLPAILSAIARDDSLDPNQWCELLRRQPATV